MNCPRFVDAETIPLFEKDEDYDNYGTSNTSRVDETLFLESDTAKATSTLRLRQKVKRYKVTSLYRRLNVTGDIDLIDLDQFRLRRGPINGATIFEFYNCDGWVPLTKQTGEFFVPKALRDRFVRVNLMKTF